MTTKFKLGKVHLGLTLIIVLTLLLASQLGAAQAAQPNKVSASLLYLAQSGTSDATFSARIDASNGFDTNDASQSSSSFDSAIGTVQFQASSQISPVAMVNDSGVLVDALASGDVQTLLNDLTALGLTNGSVYGNRVNGFLPLDSIAALNDLTSLRLISAAAAQTSVGAVDNEAIQAQRLDRASSFGAFAGHGLSIGILSDSFSCGQNTVPNGGTYAADIASGDLPDDVIVLEDFNQPGCIDEGRAMAQLVHDIAPGAQILFHSAFNGQANFAQGIIDLADAGADVIVDDIRYFAEPVYQDGIVAQAVDEVYSRGIPYFSSAGNAANQGYEAQFDDSGVTFSAPDLYGDITWQLHDFDEGPDVDLFNEISIGEGGGSTFILQWDDPFASVSTSGVGADTDLDIHLFSPDLATYFGCIFCNNNIDGDPFEGFSASGPFDFVFVIGLREGTNPDALINVYASSSSAVTEYNGDPTSWGHNNARGAIGTAAAFWGTTPAFGERRPLVNSFSSYGGIPILFDTAGNRLATPDERPGPKITGVDGSNTTFFNNDSVRDDDDNPNFFGTSAAAPNAAALALLMLQVNPDLTPDKVLEIMQKTAFDIRGTNDVGGPENNRNISLPKKFDNVSGAGLIRGDAALVFALNEKFRSGR